MDKAFTTRLPVVGFARRPIPDHVTVFPKLLPSFHNL